MPDDKRVAVLGAGMHPWGKWGRPFVEYGLVGGPRCVVRRRVGLARHPVRLGCRHDPQRLPRLRRRRHLRAGPRAGPAPGCRVATPPVHRVRQRSATHGRRSWPGSATWRWSSAPTPRPRASSLPSVAATARTTQTGCGSISSVPPIPPTSPSTPVAAWTASVPPKKTSRRSR